MNSIIYMNKSSTYRDQMYAMNISILKRIRAVSIQIKNNKKDIKLLYSDKQIHMLVEENVLEIKNNINEIISNKFVSRNTRDDISGIKNINEIYNASLIKKWIKLIPINKTILFEDYNRKQYFIPIADIILDDEIFNIKKKQGLKKRNTLIQFIPKITNEEFKNKGERFLFAVI